MVDAYGIKYVRTVSCISTWSFKGKMKGEKGSMKDKNRSKQLKLNPVTVTATPVFPLDVAEV